MKLSLSFLALLIGADAIAADYRPLKVTENDCRVTVLNIDTREVFVPELKVTTRQSEHKFFGTKYLLHWKNEYPKSSRLVSITPFADEQGYILLSIGVEWTNRFGQEQMRRNARLTVRQSPRGLSLSTLEEYSRYHAEKFHTIVDPRNGSQSKETRSLTEMPSPWGTVAFRELFPLTGLVVEGQCLFSSEREGEESMPHED